jgi:hypothetical protein
LITPMLLIVGGIQIASSGAFPAFYNGQEVGAFKWIHRNVEKDAVILTSYGTGNALPAWAPVHVVIGHGPETANLDELLPQVNAFFAGKMATQASERFLSSQGIDYVFFGPLESRINVSTHRLGNVLQIVYDQGGYAVYKVVDQ